jgi:hypothetical protein
MSAAKSEQDKGSSLDPKLIIVGIVLIVALIIYFVGAGSKTFAPAADNTYAKTLAASHYTTPSWLANDAKSCNGDFSKLDPTEQQKVLTMCKGNQHDAENAIAGAYSLAQ